MLEASAAALTLMTKVVEHALRQPRNVDNAEVPREVAARWDERGMLQARGQ